MKIWQSVLLGIILGIAATSAILIIAAQPKGEPIFLSPPATPSPMKIYITGSVTHPGVYSMPVTSRVEELVQMAGGFTSDADETSVNLAALLIDGQKIVVPFKQTESLTGMPNNTPGPTQVAYPININTASTSELTILPGIGDLKAQSIIKYREQNGPFKSIEDLQNVSGIGAGIFSKLKGLIIVK